MCGTGASASSSVLTGTPLPRGGNIGHVQFVFEDGWCLYLTSANGAKNLKRSVDGVTLDVTHPSLYGAEHDLNPDTITRLENLALEIAKLQDFNTPVIIHCNHGRTRSVISIGVYLMYRFGLSAGEALEFLQVMFSLTDEATRHYEKPGERVERALMSYIPSNRSAPSSSAASSSSPSSSSSISAPRRSARVAKMVVCDGKCK